MSIFKRNNNPKSPASQTGLAEMALNHIHDGVIITDKSGTIQFINPAAVTMTECGTANQAIGLDYGLLIKLESKEGRELPDAENPLLQSVATGQHLDGFQGCMVATKSTKRIPISISVVPVNEMSSNRIITFRDITKELAEEGEQAEFISTASHEMRTPVATIDGYLSLALNPQTATIDNRARNYLAAAEKASKHLGKLFQDLLDVTKLDDGKIRPHFEPAEMIGLTKTISDDYITRARDAKLNYTFGSKDGGGFADGRRVEQAVYGYVDVNFMREIMGNLIENAIKYTPSGGSIYVNVRGDGDKVLINVTDTGIGISSDDLAHIFQKFYRADNSDTRTVGGTGLGLYIVKQRVEAMGGRVWAESAFGEGTTFYVSLPRITGDEYEKRMIAFRQAQASATAQPMRPAQPVQPVQATQPAQIAQPAQLSQMAQPAQPIRPAQNQPIIQSPAPTTPNRPTIPNAPTIPPPAPPVAPPPISPSSPQINNNLNGVKQ